MMHELIQPNQIHYSEIDLEDDINRWEQEDSIHFNVKIIQSELHNIKDKIERGIDSKSVYRLLKEAAKTYQLKQYGHLL